GMTTGLDPAMTLGCGGWGGNITSDNISPKHLLNIKRVAYETTPAKASGDRAAAGVPIAVRSDPKTSVRANSGITPEVLGARIDRFLAARGIASPAAPPVSASADISRSRAAEFVCEEDVRQALRAGHKILLDARSIVTPAARDLGEE